MYFPTVYPKQGPKSSPTEEEGVEGVWVVTPELHPSVLTLCYLMTFLKFLILPPVAWPLWLWDIEGGRLQEHMELIPALRAVQFTVLTVLSNKVNWLCCTHSCAVKSQ